MPARHVPDFLFRLLDGRRVVTDCRPVRTADEDFKYEAAVTAVACGVIGWDFRVVGEPDPDPIRVRPVLFHLLWRGDLAGDLTRPLGEATLLKACAGPLEEP